MPLRLRLTLATLSVVTVMGVVGLVSLRINRGIQGDVEALARTADLPIEPGSILGQALAIEGRLDPSGEFLASSLERLPTTRRPKLRGALSGVDVAARRVVLCGREVEIDAATEFAEPTEADDPIAALRPGQRVEVGCRVEPDGRWIARRVETRSIKRDDKLKGTITAVRARPDGGWRLEISGLVVAVDPRVRVQTPRGPLYRMENATQMTLAVGEFLAASHELVKERYLARAAVEPASSAADRSRRIDDLEDRVLDAYETFAESLEESRESADQGGGSAAESESGWLAPLEAHRRDFEEQVRAFLARSKTDVSGAELQLKERIEPFLRAEIQPRAHAYHRHTEETLSEELDEISGRSEDAARVELFTNAAGLLLALALGLVVSRSIARPISSLTEAARRIGRGELATRVEVRSQDEIGILGTAFNRMAEELAASTVSLDQLSGVLDSMAGALLVLDPQGRVTRANPAAAAMLGCAPDQLAARPLVELSPDRPGESALAAMGRGTVATMERSLVRCDGSTLSVAFSGAALRDAHGEVRGFVCLAQDLSAHKRMEADLRRSLAEKEVLLREVHHRVKNNLQVVSSVLALQAHDVCDARALERFQESQDRIHALVFVHDLLYSSRNVGKIDLRPYLQLLAGRLRESYALHSGRVELELEVEELELDIDRAQVCGLIVSELVTNAFKHAFAARDGGRVRVACHLAPDDSIVLEVRDDGRGFSPDRAQRAIGLELVETLAAQIHGELSVDGRRGTAYRIAFPYRTSVHAA